ncbi:MAG: glycosyltransferase [Thermoguttaceae bacterium]
MTSLTIIIPFLKKTDTELFEATLLSILENRHEEDNILVVNAASYDNCYDLSQEDGVLFCPADPQTEQVEAFNIGIQNSTTPYVCPILCGCVVGEGWAESALSLLAESDVAMVVPQMRKTTAGGRDTSSFGYALSSDGVLLPIRSATLPMNTLPAPGPGGAFFRRQTLLDLGLFQAALGDWALADMAILITNLGNGVLYEPGTILTYDATALPPPSQSARITAQETLFRRWSGLWKKSAGTAHALRLFKERIFGGSALRRAYTKAQKRLTVPSPDQLLAAARKAISQRGESAE